MSLHAWFCIGHPIANWKTPDGDIVQVTYLSKQDGEWERKNGLNKPKHLKYVGVVTELVNGATIYISEFPGSDLFLVSMSDLEALAIEVQWDFLEAISA